MSGNPESFPDLFGFRAASANPQVEKTPWK
jgi:hypothetical protein